MRLGNSPFILGPEQNDGRGSMRVLVADSQSKVRNALHVLLRQQPGLEIVGEADSAGELLAQAEAVKPDLVLVHWRLSGVPGEELLRGLRMRCPGLRILALSARPESCQEALTAGADAFVSKMDQPERLLGAIRCIGQAKDAESVLTENSQPTGANVKHPTEAISDQGGRGASGRTLAATAHAAT
jgi:DNA-binding NarL/FixJ family response regulator